MKDDDVTGDLALHAALVASLTGVLDTGAGLVDVLGRDAHADLVDDLDGSLDPAAGLTEIVGPVAHEDVQRVPGLEQHEHRGDPAAYGTLVGLLSVTERFGLCTDPAWPLLVVTAELDDRFGVPERPGAPRPDVVPAMNAFSTLCAAAAADITGSSRRANAMMFDLSAPGRDQVRTASLVDRLHDELVTVARTVVQEVGRRLALPGLSALAESAEAVLPTFRDAREGLLDFTGADLRDASMSGVSQLDGVVWSLTTRWPDGWEEVVVRLSEPLTGGRYVVRAEGLEVEVEQNSGAW